MKDVGTRWSGWHDIQDFVEMNPTSIAKWFGFRMLRDVVVPGRRHFGRDAGASLVIPTPARDRLNCKDNLEDLTKLWGS